MAPSNLNEAAARAIVGWLVVTHVAFAPFALTHLDFARDVLLALEIARGSAFPLEGPVLASSIHLGPVWNYLLAGVVALTRSWLAVCVVVAALESLKFALAYMLGKMLWTRSVGVLWVAGLALPGWTLYAQVLPTHPSLVETLVLAFLLCVARFHLYGRTRSLVAAAITYALALHAHPTTFPVLLFALPPVVARLRRGELRWRALALACAAALAWFVPVLYRQVATGFGDFRGGREYFASAPALGHLRDSFAVVAGWLVTGPRVVAADLLGWGDANGALLAALLCAWTLLGVLSAVVLRARIARYEVVAFAGAVAIVSTLAIIAIRPITPYYFLFAVWPVVTGIAAVGLDAALARWWRGAPVALVLAALVLATTVEVRAATTIAGGRVRLALLPLFDVKAPFVRGTPTPFMPAYAMDSAGERYCASPGTTLHGALAFLALHDYGVGALLSCRVRPQLTLAGPRTGDQPELIGLSRPMAARLGLEPPAWFGPLGVMSIERAIYPERGYTLPADHPYPPIAGAYAPGPPLTLDVRLARDEILIASNDYFAFTMPPAFSATVDGMPIAPLAADAISTAYACPLCARSTQDWRLTIVTADPRRVDVVILRRRNAP